MATTAAMPPARARAPLASRWRESAVSRAPGAVRAPSARFRSPRRASYLVRRAPCRGARPSPRVPGAIAEPEVTAHRLDQRDKFVVLGSDGVWDRVSSQEAVQLARGCKDAEQASERITQVARERWRQHGAMADDITAVAVFFS